MFIGQKINETKILEALNKCLCTEDEIVDYHDGFFATKDPFPIPRN